jgi:hypothetical protein
MQGNASNGAGLLSGDKIVVIGVCIGNAATTGRYVVETAFVEHTLCLPGSPLLILTTSYSRIFQHGDVPWRSQP